MEPPATRGPGRPPEPASVVLVLSGPVTPADIERLCTRVRMLLEGCRADLVVCDAGALEEPDAATVDLLARLALTARRLGRRAGILDPCGELRDLLDLAGLTEVVPRCGELPLEPRGKAEEREQAGGVEEEGDPSDPVP